MQGAPDITATRRGWALTLTVAVLTSLALASCSADTSGSANGAADSGESTDTSSLTITVPDVTDQDGADAESQLQGEELDVSYDQDRSDATGCQVTDQDPTGGTELDPETDSTEVTLTLDCRQVDWENQEGDDLDAFNSAYSEGWDTGCDDAFRQSPDGTTLHYDGEEFTAVDCQNANPGDASNADVPSDVPDDPETDGSDLGKTDGCKYVFSDLATTGALYYGDQQLTASVCPGSGVAVSTQASKPKQKTLTDADYRVRKSEWDSYSAEKQLKLAQLFVANNPNDCSYAKTSSIPNYMQAAWGTDSPLSDTANKVMLAFCQLSARGE